MLARLKDLFSGEKTKTNDGRWEKFFGECRRDFTDQELKRMVVIQGIMKKLEEHRGVPAVEGRYQNCALELKRIDASASYEGVDDVFIGELMTGQLKVTTDGIEVDEKKVDAFKEKVGEAVASGERGLARVTNSPVLSGVDNQLAIGEYGRKGKETLVNYGVSLKDLIEGKRDNSSYLNGVITIFENSKPLATNGVSG